MRKKILPALENLRKYKYLLYVNYNKETGPDAETKAMLERRDKALLKAVQQAYIQGWSYQEILDYATENNFFPILIKRFANYVYTRGTIVNPFGNWVRFRFNAPLATLDFTAFHFKRKMLSVAGTLFAINVFDGEVSKHGATTKLDQAIESHKDEKIKDDLGCLKAADGLFYVDKPSVFYNTAACDKKTLLKALKSLGEISATKITAYIETYTHGSLKSRLWIAGYGPLLREYQSYYQSNKPVYRVLRKHITLLDGGCNIAEIDNTISLEARTAYNEQILNEIRNKGDQIKLRFYTACFKDESRRNLQQLLTSYEKRYGDNKLGYLFQPGLKAFTPMRIYYNNGSLRVACQASFLNYQIILLSLYGDKKTLQNRVHNKQILSSLPLDKLPEEKDERILRAVMRIRQKLILGGVHKRIHPIDSPLNWSGKAEQRHFSQIIEVSDIVRRISLTGIRIDIDEAFRLLRHIRNRIAAAESSDMLNVRADVLNEVLDEDVFYPEEKEDDLEDDFSDCTLEKLKMYADRLKAIIASARSLKNQGTGRATGHFTAAGASTHRMTCSRVNLQGIPKRISRRILRPEDGHVLISADVSGQDFVVSANLALKIAHDNRLEKSLCSSSDYNNYINIRNQIEETISSLIDPEHNPKARPIDHISRCTSADIWQNWWSKDIKDVIVRDIVKKCIYVRFYGGNFGNELSTIRKKLFGNLQNSVKHFIEHYSGTEPYLLRLLTKLQSKHLRIETLSDIHQEIIDLYSKYLSLSSEGNNLLSNIRDTVNYYNFYKALFQHIDFNMKNEYPGVFEIFDILRAYLEIDDNPENLTYPTFLGWQTVIHPVFQKRDDLASTRSRSYVVQACGAEFIRQWLIELSRTELYIKQQFRIVNVIHDQVIVEAKEHAIKEVEKLLVTTAKRAAGEVGIRPDTLHIPKLKRIWYKKTSGGCYIKREEVSV